MLPQTADGWHEAPFSLFGRRCTKLVSILTYEWLQCQWGDQTSSKELTGFRGHEMLERIPVYSRCVPVWHGGQVRTHWPTHSHIHTYWQHTEATLPKRRVFGLWGKRQGICQMCTFSFRSVPPTIRCYWGWSGLSTVGRCHWAGHPDKNMFKWVFLFKGASVHRHIFLNVSYRVVFLYITVIFV